MFAQLKASEGHRQRVVKATSVAVHAFLLAWMLHSPEPMLLNPVSVALGQNGKSVTRLYWSSKNPDDSSHSSSDVATQRYRHERLGQNLTWTASPKLRKSAANTPLARTEAEDSAKTQTLSAE